MVFRLVFVRLGADTAEAFGFVSGGFARGLLTELDDATRVSALGRLQEVLADLQTADGVQFGSSAWLVTAHRA